MKKDQKQGMRKIIALMLTVLMVLSVLPLNAGLLWQAAAEETESGKTAKTVVIAASDYQYCNSSGDNGGSGDSYDVYGVGAYGNEGSKRVVQRILGVMADQNGITSADGFLFCGDYDYDLTQSVSNTSSGLDSLKQAVSGVITSTPDNSVFVQGNHDSGIATAGMSPSGNNDPSTGKYGVFVINEDDYPWQGSSGTAEETVKQTAQNLRDYLNSKIAVNYTAPIFVVSHLPLHYSMRSKRDGDNKYANYIFDVLNEAGAHGLNIIYMFGHNHSHGWDDYLGGAQVFLTKGDILNVAQKSQTVYNEETLNFTYMNAGYTGYYQNTNNNAPSTDLTMTSFEIGDDDVIINRYSFLSQNVTSLKVAGRLNTESSYNTSEGSQTAANTGSRFSANTKTYSAPYTLTLSEVTDTEHEIDRIIPLASSSSASDADGRIYAKVNSVGELTSGGTYLLIEQGSSFLTSTLNGEGDRGFVLQGTNGLALSDTITGDYTAYEWQMDSVNGKWTFLSDNGYLKLNKDGSWWDAALVQSGASAFTVSKGDNGFTFRTTDGTNSADLNNHGTNHGIGGWDGNPTPFVIYRLVHAADEEYVSSSSAFTLYTPHTSGQILEEGDYIFYGAAKGTVLTSADHGTSGLVGSTAYTITDDIIKSDAACVVSVRVADAGSNTYYFMVGEKYINIKSDNDIELTSTVTALKVTSSTSYPGVVAISNTAGNMYFDTYNNGQWAGWNGGIGNDNERITLYKNTACVDNGTWIPVHESTITPVQTDQWAMLEPSYAIKVGLDTPVSTLREAILASAEFKAHLGYSSTGADAVALPEDGITFDTSKYNGTKLGYYEVPVYYNGINIGFVVAQVVADRKIVSLAIDKTEGSVLVGASKGANTGANFIATYEDGSTGTIPITVGMLIDYTGNFRCADLYCKTVGDYPGLGVYYKDNWYSGFTLHVLERDNYPEYPDEGSIKVDKKGWANNFAANGVAQVELTATGVPMDPGIDIVIILDTSSSMGFEMGKYNGQDVFGDGAGKWFDVDGNELSGVTDSNVTDKITRLNVMKESLSALLEGLNVIGANGKTRDINVAIADFNGYTLYKTQGNQATDRLTEVNQAGTDSDRSVVFTGSRQLDADAFVQASELAASGFRVDDIVGRSGTNYDRAMEEAYQLLAAKKAQNDAKQENRNLFCIFMSDGAPFQYNYFGGQSSPETGNTWNDWVTGKYADISGFNVPENAHTYFYNGLENRHRMAEAIKGSPEQTYTVIRPDDTVSANGQQFMQEVDGIGAKLYSIGFCLTPDKGIRIDTMDTVLTRMATSPEFYYPANSATQLNAAFNSILNDLKQAATEAYFVDNMGAAYDLQMASEYSKNGRDYVLNPAPVIEVKSYDVYTHMDVVNGVINDENRIGERKGTYDLLERVSFNPSGTEAYSNQKAAGENIFVNGLINAKCFIYNTKNEAVMIDTNDDGELDYSLAPETFYWKIGIVAETEFSLSYYVYLTGSMEGTREAGSYPTNEAAVLYYMNYLDVPCEKPTVSPKLPWLAANVSYEFYLVNTDGQPVNSSGVVVPFANRVLIGNIQSKEVLLNNTDTTEAFIAANLELPEGYTLYSEDAKYTIVIDSETELSTAEIYDNVKIKNRDTVTTYFYDEKGNYNTAGYVPNVSDYGNTHVAFGVLLVPSLIPDAVVIDYGIPVNVSVLANDLSIAAGTEINAIAKNIAPDTVLNKQGYDASRISGDKSLTMENGTAAVNGGVVRYTPTDATMTEEEILYYEVILGGKYYYSTVTVYPAQNIYYEDTFFTFAPADAWEQVGTRKDAAQAEDRPGTFNLSKIDFNNVYGYDQAYEDADAITYSLGAAYKATVSAATPRAGASPNVDGNAPLAYFTFAGTGFDLFSVTSSATGAAMVQVYNNAGARVKNTFVQTYYGFTYDEKTDEFVPAAGNEAGLYQVPVIRIRDLAYGTYTVYVTPYYNKSFDLTGSGSFDFYVDGIRIYDPAGTADSLSESIQAVYNADKEYNDTFVELRSNIISESSFYKLIDKTLENAAIDNFAPGAMYIDGINALSGEVSGAYGKFSTAGPNNELYLTKGQAVAFYLQIDGSGKAPASVQLGMKVVGGSDSKGSLLVMNSAQDKPFTVAVNGAAPRYKDITNAITWDPSLIAGTSVTGFAMDDASAFMKASGGDMSDYEWTIVSSGKNRMLGNGTNFATLTPTENSGVSAGFAPNGTGDLFSFSGANGVFTIRDESKGLSLYSANGTLITGSAISEDTYALYKKTTDETDGTAGYEKVMNASEIEAGTYVIVSLADGGKFLCPECETVTNAEGTYRTLYPIVVINNSDNIISLTNFKFAFTKDEAEAEPVAKLMSSAPARTFAMRAVKSFVLTDYTEVSDINLSGVSVEWENAAVEFGDTATLFVRTPSDIAAVTVDGVFVNNATDNGDGTKTWTYSFRVEEGSNGTCSIVLLDENGSAIKTMETGELILPATEPATEEPSTEEPVSEEPASGEPTTGEENNGKSGNWWRDFINRILAFFKTIIRWWKSLL